ncbi:hypothetical protein AVEN_2972-1 [Araneus ventricosus]|uniref:Uncharacterized protein n=1 Tax=Araneus ventricosus TaxID=182803 RepID=A0A4Y2RQF7_ARAVE|nr:hypothetical protein AVEN_2972-1 [Araneus ventricosus]
MKTTIITDTKSKLKQSAMKVVIAGGKEKSLLIHDDKVPSFMKQLHNTHESCQGSFALDNIFTPRLKIFRTGLREIKGFCHCVDCCVVVWITFSTANESIV